jgi:hypothetical protein
VIDRLFCGPVFCYNVLGKIVQNGLPALALLFFRIRRVRIKRDARRDAVCCWHKLDDTGAVGKEYSISLFGTIFANTKDPCKTD